MGVVFRNTCGLRHETKYQIEEGAAKNTVRIEVNECDGKLEKDGK